MSAQSDRIEQVHAEAYRDGAWWTIEIPELRSRPARGGETIAVGQASSLRGVDAAARDIAAVWLDVDPERIRVDVTIRLPDEIASLWADAAERDRRAREAASEAARIRRAALRSLLELGVSQSDAARALGVSPQRIGQLVRGEHARVRA